MTVEHPAVVTKLLDDALTRAELTVVADVHNATDRPVEGILAGTAAGIPQGVGNFSIVHRRVIDEIKNSDEAYLLQLLKRPYRTIDVPYAERFHGRSAYTLRKLAPGLRAP